MTTCPDWTAHLQHFERNATRPLPVLAAPSLPADQQRALAESLAIFQLGESGEGRIAHQIDRVHLRGIDDDYRAALKLFVREEGRHARILGAMVRGLGGELREENWTARLFVVGRRLLGVRLKLLVLLAAEVVGITMYGLLAQAIDAGTYQASLREICDDERSHLDFHTDFFRTQTQSAMRRTVFSVAWWAVGAAACGVVLVDHVATLRAFGIPVATAARSLASALHHADRRVRSELEPTAQRPSSLARNLDSHTGLHVRSEAS